MGRNNRRIKWDRCGTFPSTSSARAYHKLPCCRSSAFPIRSGTTRSKLERRNRPCPHRVCGHQNSRGDIGHFIGSAEGCMREVPRPQCRRVGADRAAVRCRQIHLARRSRDESRRPPLSDASADASSEAVFICGYRSEGASIAREFRRSSRTLRRLGAVLRDEGRISHDVSLPV